MSVEGEENLQEIKVKRLVLCQFLCGFACLAKGGDFLCKVFDMFTPFTVGLVFLLRQHFEKLSIIIPYTSRPANSERYIVCKNLLQKAPPVMDYLYSVNERFDSLPADQDIFDVVPLSVLLGDEPAIDWLRQHSIAHARTQIESINTLVKYIEDKYVLCSFACCDLDC